MQKACSSGLTTKNKYRTQAPRRAHRGFCAVVVENNSCEWIRGSRDVSRSQVSAGYRHTKRQQPINIKTLDTLLLPVLQIQLVSAGPSGEKNSRKNHFFSWPHPFHLNLHSYKRGSITQCQGLIDMLISALPETERRSLWRTDGAVMVQQWQNDSGGGAAEACGVTVIRYQHRDRDGAART